MECSASNCKRQANLACSGCKGSLALDGDADVAHYCNSTCQKADWAHHKATCHRLRDYTTLYRVAATAQKLFYIYRELTWAQLDVKSVQEVEQNLILRGLYDPSHIS